MGTKVIDAFGSGFPSRVTLPDTWATEYGLLLQPHKTASRSKVKNRGRITGALTELRPVSLGRGYSRLADCRTPKADELRASIHSTAVNRSWAGVLAVRRRQGLLALAPFFSSHSTPVRMSA